MTISFKKVISPDCFALPAKHFLFWGVIFPICLFCLYLVPSYANSTQPNALFLPIKVHSLDNQDALQKSFDNQSKQVLQAYGIAPMSWKEAGEKFSLKVWPPSYSTIKEKSLGENLDYVITGSVNQTGTALSLDFTIFDLLDPNRVKHFFHEGATIDLENILKEAATNIVAYTNSSAVIADVQVIGNNKIDSGAINQKISFKKGDPYDPSTIRHVIKDLYKMGYFEDVQVEQEDSTEGRKITVRLLEKAVIGQVNITGEDEVDKEKIIEVLEVSPNNIFNSHNIKDSIAAIQELYKQEGYYNTSVTSELSYPVESRVDVTFRINEGRKVYVKEITMTGNKTFSNKKLLKVIQTSEKGWLSWLTDSGVLNREIIQQDAARIGSFYHNNGFIEARIGEPEISQKGDWFYVNFNISEGERYRVGTVDLSGDLIESKSYFLSFIQLPREQYFSRQTLREDVLRITDKYAEKGYAFAEASPVTDKDATNKRMNIVIDIKKQELVHINRIIIRGNSRTRDKVVRREMQVKETGIFNALALRKSQKRLQRLDFFEDIQISPEPTETRDLMDIVVSVKEKATGNFSIGGGYSSVDSFMFMAEISKNNFLGKGQTLSLQANLSKSSTQYNLSFTEPHLSDSQLLVGIDLFNWTREYDEYDKESTGFGLRFGYPLIWRWNLAAGYSFDDTTLTDLGDNPSQYILDSLDINTTSALRVGVSRDTRNRFPDPNDGTLYNVSVKYAGGPLGGDAAFTKYDASASWYFPFYWDTSLHYKIAGGWAVENEANKLPVYEKYYLGGINSIRGFKSGSISPKDLTTNEKIGGGKMWYYNLEWIFPLVEDAGLKGVVFLDAGNVYETDESWDFGNIKKSMGFGFRWLSPMGPLRLEWGYNLDKQPDEVQDNWDFSVGGSF